MTNTLAPIKEPFPDHIKEILENYPQANGYLLSLFRTFANSTRFLSKGVPNLLDKESPLPMRIRELVILRTTANNNCHYEWGVHVAYFAHHVGLDDEQVASTWQKITQTDWNEQERVILEAVDQLCTTGSLDETTRTHFQNHWNAEQQLEIMALVGTYHTISFVANVAQLPREPFATSPRDL